MVKHASDDYTRTVERFLAGMSPPIVVTNVGAADHLFECATETTESAITAAKAKFNRTRPYRLPNNDLQILKAIKANDAPSFPSSHSAFGIVTGLILVEMAPELRERISARIAAHCLDMVVATSDQAARALNREMAAEWLKLADAALHRLKRKQ
jgi:hypothetical protein